MADTFKQEIDESLRIPAFRQSKSAIQDWNTNAPKISDRELEYLINKIWEQIPATEVVLKGENMNTAKEYVKKAFAGGLRFSPLGDVNQCEYSIGKPGTCTPSSSECMNKYCYLCGYRIFTKNEYKPKIDEQEKSELTKERNKLRKDIEELEKDIEKLEKNKLIKDIEKLEKNKKEIKKEIKKNQDKISSINKIIEGKPDIYGKLYPECEHVLPFLYGSFFVGLVESLKKFNMLSEEEKNKIKTEYKWSHLICNRLKTQGPFILYNDITNKWELDRANIDLYYRELETRKLGEKSLIEVLEDPPRIGVGINELYKNYYYNKKEEKPEKSTFRLTLEKVKNEMIEEVLNPLIKVVDSINFSPRQFYYALIIISHILKIRVNQTDKTLQMLIENPLDQTQYQLIANKLIKFGEQYQEFYNLAEQHFEEDLEGLIEYIIYDPKILETMTPKQKQELKEYLDNIKAQAVIDKWQSTTSKFTIIDAADKFKRLRRSEFGNACSTSHAIRNAIRCYGKRLKFTKREKILPYIKYRLNKIKQKHGY